MQRTRHLRWRLLWVASVWPRARRELSLGGAANASLSPRPAVSVTECGAVRPNNALERRRAALCVQAATAMWTAASSVSLWASNADEEDLIDMLVLIAGETLIRRQLFVPGEMRFSVGRLQSLFSQVHSFTDTVANVVANFRFQAHDLHRLRTGARKALRPPSHGHSTHSCARLPPHSGLRIPDRFSAAIAKQSQTGRSKRGLRLAIFNNSIANDVCDCHDDRKAIATQSQTARSQTELLHCKRMA